ncbi:Fer3-like protein [Plakobranchus ocellatus]|uniref:Fer3-like protein n=1 Tax=Plakobranchus ocellatus TaxID=259542 RepID=A0AAV4D1G9_9GAST|nr:Fer3-like protein [Plakobranchus ocellatus]
MKKKVYEKQLNQLRPDLTSNLKRDTTVKSKKTKSSGRLDTLQGRLKTNVNITSKEGVAGATSGARASSPPRKVGALPRVDVLMKRRTANSETNVSGSSFDPALPSLETTIDAAQQCTTNIETAQSQKVELKREKDNVNQDCTSSISFVANEVTSTGKPTETPSLLSEKSSQASAQGFNQPGPQTTRYRIDLNCSIDNIGSAAGNYSDEKQSLQYDVVSTLPSGVSGSISSTDSGRSATIQEGNHGYIPMSASSESQTFPMATVPQSVASAISVSSSVSATQPVSLVSSPQTLPVKDRYINDDRAHYSAHPGDYATPQHHQTISTPGGHELHTLTPAMFPASRRLDEIGLQTREGHYSMTSVYPSHSSGSWEQENNRFSDYSSSWRQHHQDSVYSNNSVTYTLNRPFVNDNNNSDNIITTSSLQNNIDSSSADSNTENKLYPLHHHPHHNHMAIADEKKNGEAYINGYASDESSCTKIALSGNGRRRRKRVQTPVQRSAANMRERRRMCHLNDAFNYLKEHLPNVKDKKKLSRIQTLKAAIYYIHLLRDSLQLQ